MPEIVSAGLMMYFLSGGELKVFLVHPGGPFFAKKDEGYWGIPKGLPEKDEEILEAAKREFFEETGIEPNGEFISLGSVVQKGGKKVYAWAFPCLSDDSIEISSNTFLMEWPPKSGNVKHFPEVDKGEFFLVDQARQKINSAQVEFLDRLLEHLSIK